MKFGQILVSASAVVMLVSCGQVQQKSVEADSKNISQPKGTLKLTCTPPAGLAGNAATVSGILKLEKHPSNVYLAKGNLDIFIGGSTSAKILDKKAVPVSGIYDRILSSTDGAEIDAYLNIGATDLRIPISISANFKATRFDVEYKGVSYLTQCTHEITLDNP